VTGSEVAYASYSFLLHKRILLHAAALDLFSHDMTGEKPPMEIAPSQCPLSMDMFLGGIKIQRQGNQGRW
jgi:hypothetical protein